MEFFKAEQRQGKKRFVYWNEKEKMAATAAKLVNEGVSVEFGFTVHSNLENRIAQLLMARSQRVYAVFDHSKIGRSLLFTIAPLNKVNGVITDQIPEPSFMEACQNPGLEIYVHTSA